MNQRRANWILKSAQSAFEQPHQSKIPTQPQGEGEQSP